MAEPPLPEWSRAEALQEVLRIARGLGAEDFDRDVLPRLRRLTEDQRRDVIAAMRATLEDAHRRGDWLPPS